MLAEMIRPGDALEVVDLVVEWVPVLVVDVVTRGDWPKGGDPYCPVQ